MTAVQERTPLYVIGGSLGSGKTTLLRRLLTGEYGRVAVLINEFGEIGIDGSLIEGRDIDMIELTGGCVCCSLAGEFAAGIRELLGSVMPDAIVVETTGVAEADALVGSIEDDLAEVRLEAVVILVDADTALRFPEFGYVERNQLETADIVVVNKVDLVPAPDVALLCERIRARNAKARVVVTEHARVDPALIFARSSGLPRPQHAGGADSEAGHVMETFHWRPRGGLRRDCFEQAVAAWPEAVFRAKGYVFLDGQMLLFNYVAGRWQLDPAAPRDAVVVCIGPALARYRDEVVSALEACIERP
jgi:G3E family GTPase